MFVLRQFVVKSSGKFLVETSRNQISRKLARETGEYSTFVKNKTRHIFSHFQFIVFAGKLLSTSATNLKMPEAETFNYPEARRDDSIVEEFHGVKVK